MARRRQISGARDGKAFQAEGTVVQEHRGRNELQFVAEREGIRAAGGKYRACGVLQEDTREFIYSER